MDDASGRCSGRLGLGHVMGKSILSMKSVRGSGNATKRVCVATPLGSQPKLEYTRDEEISLAHLHHHLGEFDKYMIAPRGVKSYHPGFEAREFDTKYFGSVAAHCAFQMSEDFFEGFSDYDYIFMYHLDCLVFSNQLEYWCDQGWDYIGAPWMPGPDAPWLNKPRVGNGGFALFNVQNCLKVLRSNRYNFDPMTRFKQTWRETPTMKGRLAKMPKLALRWFHPFNGVKQRIKVWLDCELGSDFFWADDAVRFDPQFRVADVDSGVRFAFETEPRTCFKMTGGQMPFGCHAWARYDRAFWEPHLLPMDQVLAARAS